MHEILQLCAVYLNSDAENVILFDIGFEMDKVGLYSSGGGSDLVNIIGSCDIKDCAGGQFSTTQQQSIISSINSY